jgi:hypothetical protein
MMVLIVLRGFATKRLASAILELIVLENDLGA